MFVDYKKFRVVIDIINSSAYLVCLFAIIQACYPIFRILRIADTMIGGMDKLYYYMRQTDSFLEPAMKNVISYCVTRACLTWSCQSLSLSRLTKIG